MTEKLSVRLRTVANMVSPGSMAADIGCDHGYVSIYLIQEGICPKVIAMDVHQGPLTRAKENVESEKLSDYIETRISDGAAALQDGEVSTFILAGMGGRLMCRILSEAFKRISKVTELILQPQSEIFSVRAFLQQNGYCIVREEMVLEDNQYYFMIKARLNGQSDISYSEAELHYGPYLLANRNPILKEFLLAELETYQRIAEDLKEHVGKTNRVYNRLDEVNHKILLLQSGLEEY